MDNQGWSAVTETSVPPIVTIKDIMDVTGYSRWNIREMLNRYGVPKLQRYGSRDVVRCQRQDVIDAIAKMRGPGRWRNQDD